MANNQPPPYNAPFDSSPNSQQPIKLMPSQAWTQWINWLYNRIIPARTLNYSYQVPSTGFTINVDNPIEALVLNPSGTLAIGTVVLPNAPSDGQVLQVSSSKAITSLTVGVVAGQSISNAPTTISGGSGFSYIYVSSNTTWFRLN